MDKKEMAQIFSDVIAVARMPVIVNGEVYREHRGVVNLDQEVIEAMLFAQKEVWCREVGFGSYDCYEPTMHGFDVDGCLVGEINSLNNGVIITIGCCCGHGRAQGYIQVSPFCVDKMKSLGYEELPIDEYGNGKWCFKPKTKLPTPDGDRTVVHCNNKENAELIAKILDCDVEDQRCGCIIYNKPEPPEVE